MKLPMAGHCVPIKKQKENSIDDCCRGSEEFDVVWLDFAVGGSNNNDFTSIAGPYLLD